MAQTQLSLELDRLSIEILEVLEQHGGTATTSELKNVFGHEDTDMLNYRKRKYLEPTGLIDVFQPEPEKAGQIPAQEWSLTENALEFLDNRDEGSGDYRDLGERVSLLEDQLDGLQEQIAQLEGTTGADDASPEDSLQDQLTEIASGLRDVEQEVEELRDDAIFDAKHRKIINAATVGAGVSKDILMEEYGEDEIRKRFAEKRSEIDRLPE